MRTDDNKNTNNSPLFLSVKLQCMQQTYANVSFIFFLPQNDSLAADWFSQGFLTKTLFSYVKIVIFRFLRWGSKEEFSFYY